MRLRKINWAGWPLFILMGCLILLGCNKGPITSPNPTGIGTSLSKGIPADQMTWVSWKPEVIEKIKAVNKKGIQTKKIKAEKGGKVGGKKTFGNKVKFPPGALMEDDRITVKVTCIDDNEQCGAGVDFLPSQQFLTDVKVTLSWEYLDIDEDDYEGLDFHIYFSEDDGETWYSVSNPEVDYEKQTVSVYVDHFTRYSWGL